MGAQGGVIAIRAPHRAHGTERSNTNTKYWRHAGNLWTNRGGELEVFFLN
jgi:hypothetical protein